jgi:hypothetical protein
MRRLRSVTSRRVFAKTHSHTFPRFINEVAARRSFNIFVQTSSPTLFLVVEGCCANREKLEKMHTFLLFGFVNHRERFGTRIT